MVKNGIINGYRLIDTAKIYENEEGTGQGIKEGLASTGLTRERSLCHIKTLGETIILIKKQFKALKKV